MVLLSSIRTCALWLQPTKSCKQDDALLLIVSPSVLSLCTFRGVLYPLMHIYPPLWKGASWVDYFSTHNLNSGKKYKSFPPPCSARVDGLAKRDMTATEMTEHFESRPDFLYYRHVTFSKITKRFEPAEKVQQRPIVVRYTTSSISLYYIQEDWMFHS